MKRKTFKHKFLFEDIAEPINSRLRYVKLWMSGDDFLLEGYMRFSMQDGREIAKFINNKYRDRLRGLNDYKIKPLLKALEIK